MAKTTKPSARKRQLQQQLIAAGRTIQAIGEAFTQPTRPTTAEANAALDTLRQYFQGSASNLLIEELQGIADDIDADDTYPVPPGKRRRIGVEAGCGKADCADCYEDNI